MDIKQTWEKVLEYASTPLNDAVSRKLRNGIKIQINNGKIFENAIILIEETIVCINEKDKGKDYQIYFNWNMIESIKTISI